MEDLTNFNLTYQQKQQIKKRQTINTISRMQEVNLSQKDNKIQEDYDDKLIQQLIRKEKQNYRQSKQIQQYMTYFKHFVDQFRHQNQTQTKNQQNKVNIAKKPETQTQEQLNKKNISQNNITLNFSNSQQFIHQKKEFYKYIYKLRAQSIALLKKQAFIYNQSQTFNYFNQNTKNKNQNQSNDFYNLKFDTLKSTQNMEITQILCQFGPFSKKITVFNQIDKASINHNFQENVGGTYGHIYYKPNHSNQNHSICIKCIEFKKSPSKTYQLKLVLRQYFFCSIFSTLQTGPKLQKMYGFDIILWKNCLQFGMEKCRNIRENQIYQDFSNQNLIKNQLSYSLLKMHSLNILHCDIKPSNIMHSQSYNKFIFIDFGISQFSQFQIGNNLLTNFFGTIQFCTTEMLKIISKSKAIYLDLYMNDVMVLENSINNICKQYSKRKLTNSSTKYGKKSELQPASQNYQIQQFLNIKIKLNLKIIIQESLIQVKFLLYIQNYSYAYLIVQKIESEVQQQLFCNSQYFEQILVFLLYGAKLSLQSIQFIDKLQLKYFNLFQKQNNLKQIVKIIRNRYLYDYFIFQIKNKSQIQEKNKQNLFKNSNQEEQDLSQIPFFSIKKKLEDNAQKIKFIFKINKSSDTNNDFQFENEKYIIKNRHQIYNLLIQQSQILKMIQFFNSYQQKGSDTSKCMFKYEFYFQMVIFYISFLNNKHNSNIEQKINVCIMFLKILEDKYIQQIIQFKNQIQKKLIKENTRNYFSQDQPNISTIFQTLQFLIIYSFSSMSSFQFKQKVLFVLISQCIVFEFNEQWVIEQTKNYVHNQYLIEKQVNLQRRHKKTFELYYFCKFVQSLLKGYLNPPEQSQLFIEQLFSKFEQFKTKKQLNNQISIEKASKQALNQINSYLIQTKFSPFLVILKIDVKNILKTADQLLNLYLNKINLKNDQNTQNKSIKGNVCQQMPNQFGEYNVFCSNISLILNRQNFLDFAKEDYSLLSFIEIQLQQLLQFYWKFKIEEFHNNFSRINQKIERIQKNYLKNNKFENKINLIQLIFPQYYGNRNSLSLFKIFNLIKKLDKKINYRKMSIMFHTEIRVYVAYFFNKKQNLKQILNFLSTCNPFYIIQNRPERLFQDFKLQEQYFVSSYNDLKTLFIREGMNILRFRFLSQSSTTFDVFLLQKISAQYKIFLQIIKFYPEKIRQVTQFYQKYLNQVRTQFKNNRVLSLYTILLLTTQVQEASVSYQTFIQFLNRQIQSIQLFNLIFKEHNLKSINFNGAQYSLIYRMFINKMSKNVSFKQYKNYYSYRRAYLAIDFNNQLRKNETKQIISNLIIIDNAELILEIFIFKVNFLSSAQQQQSFIDKLQFIIQEQKKIHAANMLQSFIALINNRYQKLFCNNLKDLLNNKQQISLEIVFIFSYLIVTKQFQARQQLWKKSLQFFASNISYLNQRIKQFSSIKGIVQKSMVQSFNDYLKLIKKNCKIAQNSCLGKINKRIYHFERKYYKHFSSQYLLKQKIKILRLNKAKSDMCKGYNLRFLNSFVQKINNININSEIQIVLKQNDFILTSSIQKHKVSMFCQQIQQLTSKQSWAFSVNKKISERFSNFQTSQLISKQLIEYLSNKFEDIELQKFIYKRYNYCCPKTLQFIRQQYYLSIYHHQNMKGNQIQQLDQKTIDIQQLDLRIKQAQQIINKIQMISQKFAQIFKTIMIANPQIQWI